jgi:hypothetical protein
MALTASDMRAVDAMNERDAARERAADAVKKVFPGAEVTGVRARAAEASRPASAPVTLAELQEHAEAESQVHSACAAEFPNVANIRRALCAGAVLRLVSAATKNQTIMAELQRMARERAAQQRGADDDQGQ